METTSYEALVRSAIPRDPKVVQPYLSKGTRWIRSMALLFSLFFLGFGVLVSVLDMSGGRSVWWMSFAKGFGYTLLFSLFLLGPILLFWGVNRSSLRKLAQNGQLLPARVSAIDEMQMRGNNLFMATLDFTDVTGQPRQAKFQGPDAEKLAVGNQVYVLRALGTSVGVVWPPDVLVLARIS